MKKKIQFLFFVVTIVPLFLSAQHTVNITGKTLVANTTAYAYSIGEAMSFPLNKRCIYTPGVIQPTKNRVKPPEQKLFDDYHKALLYPNPTTGVVIIETNDPRITEYMVSTYDGKVVQTGKFNYFSINVHGLQSGIYLITLFSTDHKTQQTYKIRKL